VRRNDEVMTMDAEHQVDQIRVILESEAQSTDDETLQIGKSAGQARLSAKICRMMLF
jgi:hypothetical protein